MTDDVYDLIERQLQNCRDIIETLQETRNMLLLADLIGKAPKDIKEPVKTRVVWGLQSHLLAPSLKTGTLNVQIGHDPEQVFPLLEVSRHLWPEEARKLWPAYYKSTLKKKGKLR